MSVSNITQGETAVNGNAARRKFASKKIDGTMYVGRRVPGKVISDPNLSTEKISVLDALPEVIQNAQYVGSGEYGKVGKTNSEAVRYDYFEVPVTIDGKGYVVSFDVASYANVNNYRTHKLSEIELTPTVGNRLGKSGPSSAVSINGTLVPETNVTQNTTAVNNTGALQVRFQKKIDGTMYVVEAVPDNKRSALAVVTAYIQKNSGSEGTVPNISQSEPQPYVQNDQRSSTPAASNITQGETAVNSESQGDDGLGTANAGFDPVSQWHKSYMKRDCVHSPFFTDAVSETEA